MDKVNEVLASVFRLKIEEIHEDLTKSDVARWDSLTHMDMVTSLEELLGISFDMDEIFQMQDVATIKRVIKEKLAC